MTQREYINPNSHSVHLVGPDGNTITLRSRQKMILDEYFDYYCVRGFIRRVNDTNQLNINSMKNKILLSRSGNHKQKPKEPQSRPPQVVPINATISDRRKRLQESRKINKALKITKVKQKATQIKPARIVGKKSNVDANLLLNNNLEQNIYPISNNIGVGILSYNRADCLRRLMNSIFRYTDLSKTTVFISDDASTDDRTIRYLNELSHNNNIVIIRNTERLGVAGNSNRLIRCLSRFDSGILLNDDVEVKRHGWDIFYYNAMQRTGMHHFLYRQTGIYGAELGESHEKNNVKLRVINDKPHGAVLAFSRDMLVKCGYFNEQYGFYGMEHVDWSQKCWEFGLQAHGFWDVDGSNQYFTIHPDISVVQERSVLLKEAKKLFDNRIVERIGPTDRSRLPDITYVVPFRNIGREDCIRTVISNIRAQRYPVIHTIMVEQDNATKIDINKMNPVLHYLSTHNNPLFNKSLAFNTGVSKSLTSKIILHDADMLVQGDYTSAITKALYDHESCHIGSAVIYADKESTDKICANGKVDKDINCDRVVDYFEGGSLACTTEAYWKVGGFCQDYCGYGCFAPGNYVLTDRGYIPIECVTIFDKLYTHNGDYRNCTLRNRPWSGKILDIFVPGKLPIKGVTPEHPFLVRCDFDTYKWKKAVELQKGDEIANTADVLPDLTPQNYISNSTGKMMFGKVYDISERLYDGMVYNFEVEDDKSYVVNGLIVHNCEDCDFYARLSNASRWNNSRKFDFLHLWHGRTSGWEKHHNVNKELEKQLNSLSIERRVKLQYKRLTEQNWGPILRRYVNDPSW